jgi:DNA-binding transcriptional ArsR family regulator
MKIFGNVILDYESFKALASHVRIDILKKLDEKQMTVTDLARALKISKSTAHKHLERLVEVGLVERKDTHRKWVYYRITRKGAKVLHPENVTVSLLLSWIPFLVGVFLVSLAVYLVWFPAPQVNLGDTALLISAILGMILSISGGTLVFRKRRAISGE